MDEIKDRLANLENVISNLVSSMKKIEDVQSKKELYSFSTKQLIKWLNDNEVEYKEDIRDRLIDIVWTNLNEWEWEYYYEDESEEEEDEDEEMSDSDSDKKNKKNKKDKKDKNKKKNRHVNSSDDDSSNSEITDSEDEGKAKKVAC